VLVILVLPVKVALDWDMSEAIVNSKAIKSTNFEVKSLLIHWHSPIISKLAIQILSIIFPQMTKFLSSPTIGYMAIWQSNCLWMAEDQDSLKEYSMSLKFKVLDVLSLILQSPSFLFGG
jgi:hypothetical protein